MLAIKNDCLINEMRFGSKMVEALVAAHKEAVALGHEYIGSDHVLLGILSGHNTATVTLKRLGVCLQDIESMVRQNMPKGIFAVTMGKLPRTPRLKDAIERAFNDVHRECLSEMDCRHLLATLINDQSVAGVVLDQCGVRKNDFVDEALSVACCV